MKKIAILQSNYIPWRGYFDLINMVDEFIIYDDMQYTKRDWRNRNRIQTPYGLKWISIPVKVKGKYFQKINETKINNHNWGKEHWNSLKQNYSHSKNFNNYKDIFEDLYLNNEDEYLSSINFKFLSTINKILGIKTQVRWSNEFKLIEGKSEKLLGICMECNANTYLTGPAAKGYLDENLFVENKVEIEWMNYHDYPQYKQMHKTFESGVSILDLIFNEGNNATKFMKSFY